MKIICIGRNFADHAKELKNDLPEEPLFFLKPDTALLRDKDFYYPNFTNDLHYECEIVVKIEKAGKNIEEKFAQKYYSEITLGIDFTARDIQEKCKQKGLPWEKAKGFDNSAPISTKWINLKEIDFTSTEFQFYQNNVLKQHGYTRDMIFSIDQIIAHISKFITLKTGDLIYTGTPAGVGPVSIGDCLSARLNGEELFTFFVK
jgi:2-keto-4-pentenoate hydratase/2-oxohepta-3-ene-1,7-dioic acid hydratase in catechol pathway